MDKKQGFKNFIKKEGFYVILFVCLCVVATVATVTARRNVEQTAELPTSEQQEQLAENDESSQSNFEDAELVKEDSEKENADTTVTGPNQKPQSEVKKDDNAVATSATPKKGLINPVNGGKITRTYNIVPRLNEEKTVATVFKGIDIETSAGVEVKSIADGTVLEATKGDSKEGYYVTVDHGNGLVATYANLSEELNVKAGDKVTQGSVLGKIGNSIQTSPQDRVSTDYLLFSMEKANEPVDPQKYLTEIPVK